MLDAITEDDVIYLIPDGGGWAIQGRNAPAPKCAEIITIDQLEKLLADAESEREALLAEIEKKRIKERDAERKALAKSLQDGDFSTLTELLLK